MSDIDKELTWESPLHLVAWEALGKGANDTLDFDRNDDLALQARVLPGYISAELWPQVILEPSGKIFLRADAQEVQAVGHEHFFRAFYAYLIRARNTLRDGSRRPRWIWSRMARAPKQGRFPPRVFTRHTYREFSDKMHFECKYLGSLDRARLLSSLDRWRPFDGTIVLGKTVGVAEPESHLSFRPRFVLRALVKIGVNLLAYVCERTKVGRTTFMEATGFARYGIGGPRESTAGLVVNDDVRCLNCPPNAHRFALAHDLGVWQLICSFFGGRIGAVVRFPGPNQESWRRVDIVAPLSSPHWKVTKGILLVPMHPRIEWMDMSRIVPSVCFRNPESEMCLEPASPQTRDPAVDRGS